MIPDGDSPTAQTPNPEEKTTLKLGIHSLKKERADLLIATDPDADRLSAAILHHGRAIILTGNQVSASAWSIFGKP